MYMDMLCLYLINRYFVKELRLGWMGGNRKMIEKKQIRVWKDVLQDKECVGCQYVPHGKKSHQRDKDWLQSQGS